MGNDKYTACQLARCCTTRLKSLLIFSCISIPLIGLLYGIQIYQTHFPSTRNVNMVCLTRSSVYQPGFEWPNFWYAGSVVFKLPSTNCFYPQKHISIYEDSPPLLPRNQYLYGFTVNYLPLSTLPKSYRIIKNQTAFFIGNKLDFVPENFFHFTKQIYFPLHHLIKMTGQLYHGAENIVFYPEIFGVCHNNDIFHYDIIRYFYFLDILHVKNQLELSAYMDLPEPHGVCYRNAVFSSEIFLEHAVEAVDYFKYTSGVKDSLCTGNILLIIQRTVNRRILNIDQLVAMGKALGYDTKAVAMEKLSLPDQVQLVHCAKILAGVTGAGLQWAYFMKNNSGLIEIAWPHYHWPLFFTASSSYSSGERSIRPLNYVSITNVSVQLNPGALNAYYEELFRKKGPFTQEESLRIVMDSRNYRFWSNEVLSLGKILDVIVDPLIFRSALLTVG